MPEKVKEAFDEILEDAIIDPYYSESLSKRAWFKNWNQLNDLIEATCSDSDVGNYVITSDIANFYDTIDIGKLTSDIRSEVNGENDIISLLDHFLRYWDRRLKGYSPSSKGIPQEIISDASRLLANYYLHSFDLKFKEYCDGINIIYIRWADDIFIFGKSYKQLEDAIHFASRLLMGLGLNLSAAKTKKFTKKEFLQYRCIPLLQTIKKNNGAAFIRELRRLNVYSQEHEVRLDTAIKASLNIMSKNSSAISPYSLSFISEYLIKYEYFSTLSEAQIFKKYQIFSSDIKKEFSNDLKKIISKPYASPRATFLLLIRKYRVGLIKLGLSNKILDNAIDKIGKQSSNSELIRDICVPYARRR